MIKHVVSTFGMLVFCVICLSCATTLDAETVLRLPPGEGNPRNSEGDFVQLRDGRILFVYTRFTGGASDHDQASLVSRVSGDGGITWSDTDEIVLESKAGLNVMSVSLLRLADDRIAMFYLRKTSLTDCRPLVRFSDDEAQSWSEPTSIIPDSDVGYYVLNNDRVIELHDGRLVVPVALHRRPDWEKPDWRGQITAYLSDDAGRSWRRATTLQKGFDEQGRRITAQEPGAVQLDDRRLLMWVRTDAGDQFRSFSDDGGENWTPLARMNLPSPRSPASIERLAPSGDLLAVWNNHAGLPIDQRKNRTPLTMALSTDNGRTWQSIQNLADDPNGWYCYTAIQQVGDHLLLGHVAGSQAAGQHLSTTEIQRLPIAACRIAAVDEPSDVSINEALIESITKITLRENRDGRSTTWFHPRACMVPDANGQPIALMTLQEIGGSDYFGPVHWTTSDDQGATWSDFEPIESLGRDPVEGHGDLKAGVCDVTPQYHPNTGTVLALGHVVFYRGPRFAKGDQLPRYPLYAVRRKDGTWSSRKILGWNDPRGKFIYSNNCGQRVVMPNGDIMMAFTFGPESKNRMVAGVRCSFDGEELKVVEVGPALHNDIGRGLLEPSVTRFQNRFYLTIRAEDGRGYVAVSDDGLNYQRKTAWAWDDGQPIGMSTTQQHWLTHSDGLFLVYTRQDDSNTNVMRWRSPLWIARVDTDRLCLIRDSEQVVLPMVGDGVAEADEVALMGNFHVTNVSPSESWVTVGEWLPRRNATGDLLLARIRWAKPNRKAVAFDSLSDEKSQPLAPLDSTDQSP
ncbi:MAG: exo-alpha-sialidase, partial [Pirellulaceae bacterium]|nr:exo-alpha-sialidase [Pirellulaceae bacterium]